MKKSQRAMVVVALACGALATYAWQEPTVLHNLYASATGAARGGTPAGGAHADGRRSGAAGSGVGAPVLPGAPGAAAPQGLEQELAMRMNAIEAKGAPALAPPEKEVVSEQEAARRKQMEKLGYMVPPDYYTKDVKTLRQLAKGGDAYAMVHLGEKYYFELNGNKSNPDFDGATDYPSAAKQSFKQALVAGNVRSAGIISELYLQENNPVEAYAWHIVSAQMGDSISADWFNSTKVAQQASADLKQKASARALQITAELNDMKRKTG